MRFPSGHPVLALALRRTFLGVVTLFVVSLFVFAATAVLPGNVANAILGKDSTPQSLHQLEAQLHLNRPLAAQYWTWLSGIVSGHLGVSLANGQSVASQIGPRLVNSAFLVLVAGGIGLLIGIVFGLVTALQRDKPIDHALSVTALAVTSLPDFVVAIGCVLLFSTVTWHLLPAISALSPGQYPWSDPAMIILPVAALVILVVPYVFRMTRGVLIEALESDYVEMARLKGVSTARIVIVHALPNAVAPIVQVIGLVLLYLAGGIVIVEYVFDYPGIGQGLVSAVSARDVPVLQAIVVILAAFYVVVNICTDIISLVASPKARSSL